MDNEARFAELEEKIQGLVDILFVLDGIVRLIVLPRLNRLDETETAALAAFLETHPKAIEDLRRIGKLGKQPKDDDPSS